MLRNGVLAVLGAVALMTLAGCAATSNGPSAAVGPPADVAGTWNGALVGGAPVTMMLEQSGAKVKGDLRVGGRADISGPVEGSVEGNTIKLRSSTGTAPLLNVRGDHITGIVSGTTLDMRRMR
jgi:hypothetical protein